MGAISAPIFYCRFIADENHDRTSTDKPYTRLAGKSAPAHSYPGLRLYCRRRNALAWWQGVFDPAVALLALLTAGLLQILSNLANDYGDAVKGSDKPDRIGPLRGMQKGVITQQQMKIALIIVVALICLSGLALVSVGLSQSGGRAGLPVAGPACRLSPPLLTL
jgi:hypothetical protein